MGNSVLVFSMQLPPAAVPRIVRMVDDLRDQGYVISATLTRDDSMRTCPLCDHPLETLEDLHEHSG